MFSELERRGEEGVVACTKVERRYLAADEDNHRNSVVRDCEIEGVRTWYLPNTSHSRYVLSDLFGLYG
jgi:hypothetical protein